jgi:hypothetical protein
MTIRYRSEAVPQTDTVRLRTTFKGPDGELTDLDVFPTITIVQPSGNVALGPTSSGVAREGVGTFVYDFTVGINDSLGVWNDVWSGTLNGFTVTGTNVFVVMNTQLPATNSDGYVHLGDDPGFNYSQNAIHNINKLLKALRVRLNSSGKAKGKDKYGNVIYIDCDIFSVDALVTMLADALWWFNEIPHLTMFTFDDTDFVNQFGHVLVQAATITALGSKALIERGREFTVSDNGINFTPPTVSELMNTQWSTELANHTERLKSIKQNLKPGPMGLGTLSITASRNPVVGALRHRRARQIF